VTYELRRRTWIYLGFGALKKPWQDYFGRRERVGAEGTETLSLANMTDG
jgi:hypothetical protein